MLSSAFEATLITLKSILTVYGTWLTYKVRKAPSAFNESRHLAVAIYNMALLALAYVVVKYALASSMNALGLLRLEWTLKSLVVLMSMAIIFGPKFRIIIWKDDLEEKYQRRAAAASSTLDSSSGGSGSGSGSSSGGSTLRYACRNESTNNSEWFTIINSHTTIILGSSVGDFFYSCVKKKCE